MKRLVVFCDGTWNDLDMPHPTNVVKALQAVKVSSDQIVYYDEGVGTGKGLDRITGGAFGKGIDKNIEDAYKFLCLNYDPGDEIYMFGFSRGAYTVRSLAGLIGKCGLLHRNSLRLIPGAMEIYRDKSNNGEQFRKETAFNHGIVPVTLLTCWDTVGALGIPDKVPWLPFDDWINKKYQFHDTILGAHVQNALHAIAIDERRKEFDVTLMYKNAKNPNQRLRQAWFPGDHCCIGGGSSEKAGLSNIALRWAFEELVKLGLKLDFDLTNVVDGIDTDHRIYFDNDPKWYYSEKARTVTKDNAELHSSVINRWHDVPYSPRNLATAHGEFIKQNPPENPLFLPYQKTPTELKIGEKTAFAVKSRNRHHDSKINLVAGAEYKITVSPLQVWKDGDIAPCTADGWKIDGNGAGRKEDLGSVKNKTVKLAQGKRVVKNADWFCLICEVGSDKSSQKMAIGTAGTLKPKKSGRMYAFANDVASSWDWIDKYDNNKGYIIAEIERVS